MTKTLQESKAIGLDGEDHPLLVQRRDEVERCTSSEVAQTDAHLEHDAAARYP